MGRFSRFLTLLIAGLAGTPALVAETIPVRYPEGVVRAFLALRAADATVIADGEFIQAGRGNRVTTRTVFRFRDGSLQDETAVFTQSGGFRLLSDRLLQRGPSFPRPMELRIDAAGGKIAVTYAENGSAKSLEEKRNLPLDLANGIVPVLLKNLSPETSSTTLSMVVASPKPRLVTLAVSRAGTAPLTRGRLSEKATVFRLHVELGGVAGRLIAPLVGRQPKDASVWILEGKAPGFMRSESQFYDGAPLWTIELAAPGYPGRP